MTTIDLHLNPKDAAALQRVVDPDGRKNGDLGITIVPDDTVRQTYIEATSDDAEFPASLRGVQKIEDFDVYTSTIITLSHNAADDFESTKLFAFDGAFDRPEAREQYTEFVGIEAERILAIAQAHTEALEIGRLLNTFVAEAGEFVDDEDDPDTTLEGTSFVQDEHLHPETLTEHGGEG